MAYNNETSNAPLDISLNTMLGILNDNGQITRGCRFLVKINPRGLVNSGNLPYLDKLQRDLVYACDAAEFPGRGFGVTEARYYGPRQLTPNNTIYGDGLSMSFICRSKSLERQFFDDWMDIINPSTTFHFKYPQDYYATVDVYQYSEYGKGSTQLTPFTSTPENYIRQEASPQRKFEPVVLYSWRLEKAWPTLVQPQQVTWADSDILRLNVQFAFKKWSRPNDDINVARKLTS